jgi:hypothetical protein
MDLHNIIVRVVWDRQGKYCLYIYLIPPTCTDIDDIYNSDINFAAAKLRASTTAASQSTDSKGPSSPSKVKTPSLPSSPASPMVVSSDGKILVDGISSSEMHGLRWVELSSIVTQLRATKELKDTKLLSAAQLAATRVAPRLREAQEASHLMRSDAMTFLVLDRQPSQLRGVSSNSNPSKKSKQSSSPSLSSTASTRPCYGVLPTELQIHVLAAKFLHSHLKFFDGLCLAQQITAMTMTPTAATPTPSSLSLS